MNWLELHEGKVNVLSARQYSMAAFLESIPGRVVSYQIFKSLNMGTVRSFVTRGYLEERVIRGARVIYWTQAGSEAVRAFVKEKFDRNPSSRFSSALSLELYDRSREAEKREGNSGR